MPIQDKVENMLIELQKDGDTRKRNILKLIVSDFQRRPNLNIKLSDEEALKIIKKFIKNNVELLNYVDEEKKKEIKFENDFLSEFLPAQVSDDEIRKFIEECKWEITQPKIGMFIGKTISHFKEIDKAVDGGNVRKILLEFVS